MCGEAIHDRSSVLSRGQHAGRESDSPRPQCGGQIAVMGGQGAVNILYRNEIKQAEGAGEDVAAVRTKLANEYTYNVASPFLAAERGELDGVIEPAATRVAVIKALRSLRGKRASLPPKKHGNIPL